MWRLQLLWNDHGWKLLLALGVVILFGQVVLFGGVKSSTALVFAGVLAAWAGLVNLALPGPPPIFNRPSLAVAAIASVLLVGWIVLSLLPVLPKLSAPVWAAAGQPPVITYDRAATLRELVKLCAVGAVFTAGLTIGGDRRYSRYLLRLLGAATAAYALWSVVTFSLDPELLLGAPKTFHQDRLTGTFYSANTAGSLFGGLGVLFLALAGEEWINQAKREPEFGVPTIKGPTFSLALYAFAGVLCLGALMLTGSRFAIVATGGGMALAAILIALLAGIRAWIAILVGLAALTLAVALPILSNAGAARRSWNLSDTVSDRIGSLQSLTEVALTRPVQGHGLGTFRQAVAPSIGPDNLRLVWDLGAAHNLGIQWFLETGLVGAGLAGLALLATLCALWPFPLKRSRPGRGRLVAAIGLSVVLLLHNMVDYSLQVPAVACLFALILGLAAAATFKGEH